MDLIKTTDTRELKLSIDADKITRQNHPGTVLVRPGQIEYFAMRTPPKVWFECNGGTFNPDIYIDLSNAIGDTWGRDGTNFKLPDYRGCFLRSWANDSTIHDEGRVINTFQDSDIKKHSHEFSINEHNHTVSAQWGGDHKHNIYYTRNHGEDANGGLEPGAYRGGLSGIIGEINYGGGHKHGNFESSSSDATFTTNSTGDQTNNHETRPPNFSILVCIKY